MFSNWFRFLKRSPRAGDGKDRIMSHPTESPGMPGNAATQPAPQTPAPPPDVSKQIADLTDAVNRLVQAQQDRAAQPAAPATPAPDTSLDVGGDIPGGSPLVPAVDYAKLSPVLQIALGLRDARPVGPARRDPATSAPPHGAPENDAPPVGAD